MNTDWVILCAVQSVLLKLDIIYSVAAPMLEAFFRPSGVLL